MTLSEALDRLEALGRTPLCQGAMSDGEHLCAAAHLLILSDVVPPDHSFLPPHGVHSYSTFERAFGFHPRKIYWIADNLGPGTTAEEAARFLYAYLTDLLPTTIRTSGAPQ